MFRFVIAMIAAVFPFLLLAAPATAQETGQLTQWMRVDQQQWGKSEQAQVRGGCRVSYGTGNFLRDLGRFNAVMNEQDVSLEERRHVLIEKVGVSAQCVLFAQAERKGAVLSVLVLTTKGGDFVITDFEDGIWRWDRWRRTYEFKFVSRQHPYDPDKWLRIVN